MLKSFLLPDLGEGLEEAEVVRWLVSEGDEVELNQPIVEVDTEKAVVEIPSPYVGRVAKLNAEVGDVVAVGSPLITFEVADDNSLQEGDRSVLVGYGPGGERKERPTRRRHLSARAAESTSASSLAAPVVRKLAADLGVGIDNLHGTGPGGRITRDDVLAAAGTTASTAAPSESQTGGPEERIAVRGVRRLIADKMTRSVREIPHVTTFLTVDATALLDARRRAEEISKTKVTPLAFIGMGLIEICKKHPKLNASWDGSSREIVLKRYYNLGVATDTERGLVVSVIKNVDEMNVGQLASEITRVSGAVRDASATPDETRGSTVTITNVGTFHAEFGTPIINWPESAILALGEIQERPAAVGGKVVVRPQVTLSLSFDHRVMDGAEAGRALFELKQFLEDVEVLSDLVRSSNRSEWRPS